MRSERRQRQASGQASLAVSVPVFFVVSLPPSASSAAAPLADFCLSRLRRRAAIGGCVTSCIIAGPALGRL